jgi:16S rRNA G966 N2-methylase RsmD
LTLVAQPATLKIDPEFQAHLWPLAPEERAQLAANIEADGCREAIVTWRGIILDGHNRYAICHEVGIGFRTKEVDLPDRDAALDWIDANQLGRRNLTPDQTRVSRGRLYNRVKKMHGGDRRSEPSGQNDHLKTADRLAVEHGVSSKTIRRDAKFAEEVDRDPELAHAIATKTPVHKIKKEQKQRAVAAKKEEHAAIAAAAAVEAGHEPHIVEPDSVWQLGRHILYCGDTSGATFRSLLPRAALAFADPPYGAGVAEWDATFVWDHDYLEDAADITIVTPGIVSIQELMRRTTMTYRWSLACWIDNGMTRSAVGFGNWIYAAVFASADTSVHRNAQDHMRATIKTNETDQSTHRGRKPASLMVKLLETYTREHDIVIDPFLGSGTTLLVAEQMNRACVGGEIDPHHCAEIINRWETLTGQRAQQA